MHEHIVPSFSEELPCHLHLVLDQGVFWTPYSCFLAVFSGLFWEVAFWEIALDLTDILVYRIVIDFPSIHCACTPNFYTYSWPRPICMVREVWVLPGQAAVCTELLIQTKLNSAVDSTLTWPCALIHVCSWKILHSQLMITGPLRLQYLSNI